MAVIYASVTGGTVVHEGHELQTFRLQTAINRLAPGDVLEILAGRYTQPATISEGGVEGAPIRIKGCPGGGTLFDGQQEKESANDDFDPMDDDFAFVKIIGADWIEVEQIRFERCWPSAVFIRGSKHIRISDCSVMGARFAVYARNRRWFGKTRHITLSGLTWVQDTNHDMWEGRITWMDVKQQQPTQKDARYLNGALFGSYDIKGPVTIENCDVSHAFNAIRMDAKSRDLDRDRNADIRIAGNRFSFIRDNAVEPEKVAERLYVVDNVFFNVHATFSLDAVTGRHWYYIGNRLLNILKPGVSGQSHRGGKIFKFHSDGPYPVENFNVLFNSVQTRTAYIKSGQTRELRHANNAIGICREGPDCDAEREMFGADFAWHASLHFSSDLCDHPDFPGELNNQGYEVSGTAAPEGAFESITTDSSIADVDAGWDGQLHLKSGSPGQSASEALTVRLPDGAEIFVESGRDIGAPAPSELLALSEQTPPSM